LNELFASVRPPAARKRGRRLIGVVALTATLVVAGTVVSLGGAGSVRTSASIRVLPHVLTLNSSGTTQGFIATHFTNAGPSTVNHAVETISTNGGASPLPLPTTAFTTLPSGGCTASTSGTGSIITCDIGQVPPGTVDRIIPFSTATPASFTAHLSVRFDEGKGTNLSDTNNVDDFPASIVTTGDGTQQGKCIAGSGSTVQGTNAVQATLLNYPGLGIAVVPCTPGDAGVKSGHPANPPGITQTGDTSFAEFLDGNGLATVKISIFNPAAGVTKKTLRFVEYANYPDPTPTVGTDGSKVVPSCVNGQIPATGFHSCVVGIDPLSGGGLIATLFAQGGTDPGWGHT